MPRKKGVRVLIYSHDSFGLGHLRRCRAIAHALVDHDKGARVLIISGSPVIGRFDFRARVDFVNVPGIIKLRNGAYTPLNLHVNIDETLAIRASIIEHTARAFEPDLFLVDKEPLGLRGEVANTLKLLKRRGVPLVLGLRDVMDEPMLLAPEWRRKNVLPALRDLYDQIWVYGLPEICDPLEGIVVPDSVRRKMVFTGYLRRTIPKSKLPAIDVPSEGYLLVTPGGGGDGENLVDWVLSAYEQHRDLPHPAVIVFGPFLPPEAQQRFLDRIARLEQVTATTFESHMEALISNALGVVAMGGYNTFCEILSFDKPALIVPRMVPRMEQYIRARRAQEMGMVRMLMDSPPNNPALMAAALRALPDQLRPSRVVVPGLMDGLENINRIVDRTLRKRVVAEARASV